MANAPYLVIVDNRSVNPESGEGTANHVLEEDGSIISRNDAHEEEEDDNSSARNDL